MATALLTMILVVPAGADARAKPRAAPALPAFSSCKALLTYAHAGALRAGGTEGVVMRTGFDPLLVTTPRPTPVATAGPVAPQASEGAGPATTPSGKAADASTDPTFSTTNDQEQGVDEPDVVKTDGKVVYAVTDSTLRVIDITRGAPVVVGTLPLAGYGHELLLRGGRLLVMATGATPYPGGGPVPLAGGVAARQAAGSAAIAPRPGFGTTLLTEVDVSTPSAPKVARTMTVDGDFVDARLTGGTARLVIGSAPDPIVAQDDETLKQAIAHTGTGRFIPRTVLRSAISGRTFRHPLAACRQIRHPRSFSGTGLLTIMTVDLDRGLYSVDRDAVMAGAQVVYGSTGSLYVASRRYDARVDGDVALPSGGVKTEIHRFDASREGVTTYRSTGTVDGFVLNQYALSEYDGRLRVATTSEPEWFEGRPQQDPESAVTVLGPDPADAGRMTQVGRVGGLGKGERIYAVRFVGDAGYVVTFRQIDPLYVVDLATPTAPKVRGELKITGYSAYLHPVGDGLLLGVGQEATPEGRRAGSQVSLFDVSDPANPRRLSQKLLGDGSSSAEFDPHAFLYWAPTRLAVLPLSDYGGASPFTGAVGLHVDRSAGITEAGRTRHSGQAPIVRSLVAGGKLYTLSYAGLGRSSLDTLADEAFVPFG